MTLYKNKYRIESTRLPGWDYSSPGFYFVTICVKNRECLFGEIINGKMVVNEFGRIVQNCWDDLTNHYNRIKLDEFIIMPNHVHGILIILSENDYCNDSISSDCHNVETGFKPNVETGLRPVLKGGVPVIPGRSNHIVTGKSLIETGLKPVSTEKSKFQASQKRHGLSEIVRALKSYSAQRINKIRNSSGITIWQSLFYDHIIRDEDDLLMIREYIQNNPAKWEEDEEYIM
jgi:REP element-mobilizing transposase RayT